MLLNRVSNIIYKILAKSITNFAKIVTSENHSTIPPKATVDVDHVYAEIAKELEDGVADKGLWIRLFAECGGDERQTKVLYIKQRADRLIATERSLLEKAAFEQAKRLAQAARERAAESARLEKLRLEKLSLKEQLIEGNITEELSNKLSTILNTPMAVAVLKKVRLNNFSEVSTMLDEEPLLVAVTNNDGETPLHIAVDEHNQEMARFLLERGATAYAKNIYGVTPLEYAENSRQSEMVELLTVR